MQYPVAILALLGVMSPAVHAVSIKDDVVSITPTVRLQMRLQHNDATTGSVGAGTTNAPDAAVGDEYRIQGGVGGAANDPLDFSIRRARFGLNFKYGSAWKGQVQLQADNLDQNASNTGRAVSLRFAWLERAFDIGDGMGHALTFGLQQPYYTNPSSRLSSNFALLPNDNAAAAFLGPRGVGLGYRFEHPLLCLAADLQNNTSATKDTTTAASAGEEEGFFYGVRAEFSFSREWFIRRRAESFLGKEGRGCNLGLTYSVNQDQINEADATSTAAYGVDLMLWLDRLSAYAEYRAGTVRTAPFAGASTTIHHRYIVVQAGYALPLADGIIEPALRYQIIDTDTGSDQVVNYGNNTESGAAGSQTDIGLNYYLAGHDHRIQLGVSRWRAEAGQGDATIIRLQHHINF